MAVVACLMLALSITGVQAQEATAAATAEAASEGNPFGVVEGFWLPDVVCQLHPGWERIIFDWSQIQPNGTDDWNTLNVDERWLKAAQACNREVIAMVEHTPKWATDGTPLIGVPRGLTLPIDDPNNLWASFMRKAAAYYAKFGVKQFILWNEPDIDPGVDGYEFEGTVQDYARLLKVGYLAAKAGNPDAIIHLAGTTYWHDVNQHRRLYDDRLFEALASDPDAAANGDYFDVLTLHIYFQSETVYSITKQMAALLDKYGLKGKSIWIDETNASPNLDPQWPVTRPMWQITLDQQAAFLAQAAALGLTAGADHVGVYKFYDWTLQPGQESFGLLRADQSKRPAFDTWAMVIQQMNGVQSGALAQSATTDVVRLTRSDGQEVLVAWARTAQDAQIQVTATANQAQFIDQYGKMVTMRPLDNQYTLALPGATCNTVDGCPVGGNVALLVQPSGSNTDSVSEMTTAGLTPLTFG
ncbi:MAG TPA: hypothetical protein VHD90_20975 [Phototrophicaceae bacterium]|nr:hypothetical protein [Phototrophicaceae bacterium]